MSDPILVFMPQFLERRYCTAESPMLIEDKDNCQWGHPDAVEVRPFFNLFIYTCPHCALTFHAPARNKTEGINA